MGGKTLIVEARGSVPELPDAAGKGKIEASKGGEEQKENEGSTDDKDERPKGGARLKVTGRAGKVMMESSDISLTYAQMFLREVDAPNTFLEEATMHMNLPEGATPKDGPSAGVTMTSALLSLALDRPVKKDLAFTGEMTLTGKVLRVGGIKEKALAARRENVGTLILPMASHADYIEIKPNLRAGLTAHFVDHFDDVYRLAFEDSGAPMPAVSRGTTPFSVHTPASEAIEPPPVRRPAPAVIVPIPEDGGSGEQPRAASGMTL